MFDSLVQVVPTVGVSGEDGEKRRTAMLNHFRHLVDGTAAKANFLSRWTKSSAAKDASEEAVFEHSDVTPGGACRQDV